MVEPPVYLESPLSLSLEERIELERDAEEESSRPDLKSESAAYLWLCSFINSFAGVTNFRGVMRLMDGWVSSMRGELAFVDRSLTYPECQVCYDVILADVGFVYRNV